MLHQAQRTGQLSACHAQRPTCPGSKVCQRLPCATPRPAKYAKVCQRLPCATPWPAKYAKVCQRLPCAASDLPWLQSLPAPAKPVKTGQSRPGHTYYFRNSGIFTIFVD